MSAILLVVNLFFALWIRQVFINRKLEKIILKYYIEYGFLPYDMETPRIIDEMEERTHNILIIKSRFEKIKRYFRK